MNDRPPTSQPDLSAYAGRWVALVAGQVTGHGLTPEEARSLSFASRPKERPYLMRVPAPEDRALPLSPLVERVRAALPPEAEVWLVGGAVRDALLEMQSHDLDFAVDGDALALARAAADALGGAYYPLDDERGTGRVILDGDGERHVLDFARLRGPTIDADLAARDFTLNAIAIPLADLSAVHDPLGGEADLRAKLLRACSPGSIRDDPLRGLRAVRLAAQFGLRMERATRAAIRAEAGGLARVSAERIRDEFLRAIGGRRPAAVLRALDMLDLLDRIAPEATALKNVSQTRPHVYDVWEHTLATLDRLAAILHVLGPAHDVEAASELPLGLAAARLGRFRDALAGHLSAAVSADRPARHLLALAALLHDVGKPRTRTVDAAGQAHFHDHASVGAELAARRASQLRLSGDEVRRVRTIVAHHLRPLLLARGAGLGRRAIYRFFRDAGEAGVEVCLLSLADTLATWGPEFRQDEWTRLVDVVRDLLEAYFHRRDESLAPEIFVTGRDLMKHLGLPEGPQVGELLEYLREAAAAGEVGNREQALEIARRRLSEE